jgi:hypothetical protein
VFAVIDTTSKTGTENDATTVTFFAKSGFTGFPLLILDWDIAQIEGALLETRGYPHNEAIASRRLTEPFSMLLRITAMLDITRRWSPIFNVGFGSRSR